MKCVWAGPTSLPRNFHVDVRMCQQWRRFAMLRNLAKMWRTIMLKTQMQLIRVCALGDLHLHLDRLEIDCTHKYFPSETLGAKHRVGRPYRGDTLGVNRGIPLPWPKGEGDRRPVCCPQM